MLAVFPAPALADICRQPQNRAASTGKLNYFNVMRDDGQTSMLFIPPRTVSVTATAANKARPSLSNAGS